MLEKHPHAVKEIYKALEATDMPQLSSEKAKELLNADELLEKHATRVQN